MKRTRRFCLPNTIILSPLRLKSRAAFLPTSEIIPNYPFSLPGKFLLCFGLSNSEQATFDKDLKSRLSLVKL